MNVLDGKTCEKCGKPADLVYRGGFRCNKCFGEPFKGPIPPIAEREKKGKRLNRPPIEITYIHELTTTNGTSINLPPAN